MEVAARGGWIDLPFLGDADILVRDSEVAVLKWDLPTMGKIDFGIALSTLVGDPVRIRPGTSPDAAWDQARSWLTEERTLIMAAPQEVLSVFHLDLGHLRAFAGLLTNGFGDAATVNAREVGRMLAQLVDPPELIEAVR